MPSRCRARNCRDGFYYDSVTFVATDARVDTVFDDLGSAISEKVDVDGVDEVSPDSCLPNAADQKSPRSVDCWSSYCHSFAKRMVLIQLTHSLEQYAFLSQVTCPAQVCRKNTDDLE